MNNYLIDNHFHLDLTDDIETILNDAKNNGVEKFIISGCDRHSILDGLDIINRYVNVYMTIGFHPDEVDSVKDQDIKDLETMIKNNKKIIGIGEIGLDYYHNDTNIDRQKEVFILQIELARKLDLPIVVHSRESIQDTYDILSNYKVRGIIHCFSGSLEMAKLFVNQGFYLGIGGVLTFKNSKLKNVVKEIDLINLVLETDSPYLSPEPYRGKVNEPRNIKVIAKQLALVKDISLDKVAEITTNNSEQLFKI